MTVRADKSDGLSRQAAEPVVSALTGFDPPRVVFAFNKRLKVYRTKRDAANPFGEDLYNRRDAIQYVVESIEILAREAGLAELVSIEPDEDADDLGEMTVPEAQVAETIAAIAMEARQGRDGETRLDPKDESDGAEGNRPNGRVQS